MARIRIDVDGSGWEFTREDGRFCARVPGPGTQWVRALVTGLLHGEATEAVVVAEDGTSEDVVLRFSEENTLRGRALLPDGRPAVGVVLKITTKSNDMGVGPFAEGIWSTGSAHSWLAVRTGFGGVDPRSDYQLWWMGDDGTLRRHSEVV